MAKVTSKHVALLRGINVGGKNMLPMRDLVTLFERAGCADVVTYIQSGNVVFTPPSKGADGLDSAIAARIEKAFGLRVPVVMRTAAELARTANANPFLAAGSDQDHLHVLFLANAPKKIQVSKLDAKRSPGDEFAVLGRDVYLCCPNGVARTKLTNAYFDSALETVSTGRNWRTVLKLVEMSAG